MIKSFSIKVSGKVQGVFFRASAREKADAVGVTGFVRNEADGSVYIEVQGEEDAIEEFIHWCRQGPPRARVDRCEVREIDGGDYQDFEVRRG
ncbi:MAG TPA: acylphosphatase [Chryseosolibacter sp.]|nr:acylphosphatase [Chryseosolibacter sp.]